jgi:hypothetical protein
MLNWQPIIDEGRNIVGQYDTRVTLPSFTIAWLRLE